MKYCHIYTFFISVIIIVLSLIPIPEVEPLEDVPFIDKWTHLAMYAAMAFAMWADFLMLFRGGDKEKKNTKQRWCLVFFSILIPTLLGGALELIQPSVNRSCELMDFVADGVGAVIGTTIGLVAAKVYKG